MVTDGGSVKTESPGAGAPDQPINPSQAINIDPLFASEHPPLIGRDMWVDVNIMQIRSMGGGGMAQAAA